LRLYPAVAARPPGGEFEGRVVLAYDRAVVGEPGLAGDARRDTDHVGRHRRVADGVDAGPGVAGRDEHLYAVVVDQLVIELGARVVRVVQRRQPADRHVDDVD